MDMLSRVVLVRHGETVGESSIRYYGATDVGLSDLGRAQARAARDAIPGEGFDLVVSSSLSRAWETAGIVSRGAPVRLEADFREIDFGRWEGLTKEEIAAVDPILYEDWESKGPRFEFPEGEPRGKFRARVERGLERIVRGGAESVIVVAHKGVVRGIVESLCGDVLSPEQPALGQVVHVIRRADQRWHLGQRSS